MTKPFRFSDEVEAMTATVLDPADRIQARNQLTASRFDEDVIAAGWHRLKIGDSFTPHDHALVIGAVTWNTRDLDTLADLAVRPHSPNWKVYVFNLDDVHSAADLERFMPGASLPTKTPVVAEYKGALLVRSAQGESAMDFLANMQPPKE